MEIKLKNLDTKYKASHHAQWVLTNPEATHLTALMERKTVHRFGVNAPHAGSSCRRVASRNTSNLIIIPEFLVTTEQHSSLKSCCGLSAPQQPNMRDICQTNYLSVSIAIHERPVLAPVTTRCQGRRGVCIKSQRSVESLLLLLSFNWT